MWPSADGQGGSPSQRPRVSGLLAAQLRARWGRALALGIGVVVATTAFTVLTGRAEVERLELRGQVEATQGDYHVLVRPMGARSELEADHGLVQPYQMSGQFGGIALDDYDAIRDIPGVEVAAPVAMVGYVMSSTSLPVEVDSPPPASGRELLVADVAHVADRGLSTIERTAAAYSYYTSNPTTLIGTPPADGGEHGLKEISAGGSETFVCPTWLELDEVADAAVVAARERNRLCASTQPGSDDIGPVSDTHAEHGVMLEWSFPVLVAAVDPDQEALLSKSDAVPASLLALAQAGPASGTGSRPVPVVVAEEPAVDAQASVTVRRLPDAAAERFASGLDIDQTTDLLDSADGEVVATEVVTAEQAYRQLVASARSRTTDMLVDSFWTTEPTVYDVRPDGALAPRPVVIDQEVWRSPLRAGGYVSTPVLVADTGFREVRPHTGSAISFGALQLPQLEIVDTFDAADFDAAEFDGARGLPAADSQSRQLLGGQTLLSSGNPASYQLGPPTAFIRLSDLGAFTGAGIELADAQAPISAIRVRVAEVTGMDEVDRERVRVVADQIREITGLDVDVVLGGSAASQTVMLAAGEFGRPPLALSETWVSKGVGIAILEAVDRKSVALFVLVLAVCALYVGNVTAAATRARIAELAVLSRVGWSRGQILRLLLAEVGLVGLAAGVVGAVASVAVGSVLGAEVTVRRAAIAVPIAVTVALVSAAWPAWRASRPPIASTQPLAVRSRPSRRWPPSLPGLRSFRGVRSLAVANVLRSPARSGLGVLAVALGCAALTVLLGITLAFHGTVVGTVLGDAVSVRARTVDYTAALVTIAMSGAGVADVVFLNMRDRRAEFAVLQAVGWSDGRIRRLVLSEAALIGLAGAVLGTVAGVVVAAVLAGSLPAVLLIVAVTTVIGGAAVPVLASLVPAAALRRVAVATTLTRDA